MNKLGEILKTLDGLMDYVDDRIDKAKRGPRPERVYVLNELTRIKAELLNAKYRAMVNNNTSFKDLGALTQPALSTNSCSSTSYPYKGPAYIFQGPYGVSYVNKESSGDDVAAGEKDSNEGLFDALLKMFEEIEKENDEADIKGIEPKHFTISLKFKEPW